MSTAPDLTQLHEIIDSLDEAVGKYDSKNKVQKEIFGEYIKIFHKLSQKLALLANKINEQILIDEGTQNENISTIFQHLSNSILRLADCSKNVAIKAKNQVFDPMKLFCENYKNLNSQQTEKLRKIEQDINDKTQQLNRNRDNYISASQKLEKHKAGQARTMTKIQNGDLIELEKFNSNIRKITENINSTKQSYQKSIIVTNLAYESMRKQIQQIGQALMYNEQSRVSFSKKSVVASIRILQDFTQFYDKEVENKIQDSTKMIEEEKYSPYINKSLELKVKELSKSQYKEQFVSYEEINRLRRKKSLQGENIHLHEIFSQVSQRDRNIIIQIIKPWFKSALTQNVEIGIRTSKFNATDIDECKVKILEFQPYSFYFIQEVYQRINEMSSFYCKLQDDNFLFILNTFQTISNNLQIQKNTALSIEFLYKMAQISLRILWMKNTHSNKGHPLDLLCQYYGKNVSKFNNQAILKKIFLFIQKKKSIKKQINIQQESKGVLNSFTKNIYAALNRKKQVHLNDEELFICLEELTHLMANLLVPTDVSLPFLKNLLGKNQNSKSFQYLKAILLEKKDRQQRQKIFYRTEIKQKKEKKMKQAIENKKMAEYCLMIVAKKGFLTKSELNLRLISKELSNIHKEILIRLPDIPDNKWIHLIPYDPKIRYIEMKQEVAEQSVPSHIQQIITLDVNRSLHNHGEYLNPTILHSLLRVYAYYHNDISYCQGMNYIAGYLYIKTRNQEEAYRIFEYLMETRFKELFANEFQVLKVKMYQFQRLLSIFFPQISEHFKKQSITPECYIVSWVITLFASSYQYTMESYLIDLLWQRFIVWGWAEFFKFVLALFNTFKDELLQLTYDRALHFLGEMGRSQMFLSNKQKYLGQYRNKQFNESLQQYPISEQLLLNLEKQYKLN